ncbi:uncharacterized protein G2W53_022208 [Senna tora]|uniref:Uncharacterized protein n=1 Tax=Senna tora TaxID=362788 RepID=A0A834TML4_9FABA|nr:uncharacterized protein G2W53_022208 [Senna tora]
MTLLLISPDALERWVTQTYAKYVASMRSAVGSSPLGIPTGEMRTSGSLSSGEGQVPPIATAARNIHDPAEDAPPSRQLENEPFCGEGASKESEEQVWGTTLRDRLPLAVKLATRLLFEALLGLQGVVATAHSSKGSCFALHQVHKLLGKLVTAHQTTDDLRAQLSVKEASLSSMIRLEFGKGVVRPSGVKEEPACPKGSTPIFNFPIDESRKDRHDNGN